MQSVPEFPPFRRQGISISPSVLIGVVRRHCPRMYHCIECLVLPYRGVFQEVGDLSVIWSDLKVRRHRPWDVRPCKFKRGHSTISVRAIIHCKLYKRYVVAPVSLLFADHLTKHRIDLTMLPFHRSVGLGMPGGRHGEGRPQVCM